MTFEYMATQTYLDSIDIDDLGNVCLNALNDNGDEYYLIVTTNLGWVEVIEYGPCTVDFNTISSYFNFNFTKFEYSDSKISKIIEKFINNDKRNITQVYFSDRQFALKRYKELKIGEF